MKLSLDIQIQALSDFSICYFKDILHDKNSPPHRYIVIPTDNDLYLIVCIITSQIDNKFSYYSKRNEKCLASLVVLEANELDCLTTKSVIDCNNALYLHKHALVKRIVPGTYTYIPDNIDQEIIARTLIAIDSSPLVKRNVKKSIQIHAK